MRSLLDNIASCAPIVSEGPFATVTTTIEAVDETDVGDFGVDIRFKSEVSESADAAGGYRMYLFVVDDTLVQVKAGSSDLRAKPPDYDRVPRIAALVADRLRD